MKSDHRTSITQRFPALSPPVLRAVRVRFHDVCVGLLLLILSVAANGQPAQFFVAADGNDSWSGTLTEPNAGSTDGPFASLERARDAIRNKKKTGQLRAGAMVQIRQGAYELKTTFTLNAADSGSENAPIIYQAYKDETVSLRGGPAIRGFQPVSDPAMAKRLPPESQGKIWSVDLKAAGITDFGEVATQGKQLEIFFNEKPMQLARWPNEGFVKIGEVLGGKPVVMNGIKGDRSGIFTYTGDRPKRWVNEPEGVLHGYWFWDWSDAYQQIGSIDTAKRVLKLKPPFHSFGYRPGQRYYALNLLSELDQPGEWYLDRAAGRLYFWPPGPLDKGEVVLSVLPTLIQLRDASWLAFRGLNLEATRGTAIVIEGGNHARISNCTIRNTGSWAVRVEGGTDHGVEGCHIYQLGEGGISLQGGDRMKLIPAKHYAANNHIHDFGRLYRAYRPAIALGGVGQAAAHNHIHDGPHNAIQFGGNDHLIEFNEVHHVCEETGDVGAFYTGRDWTARGTLIRCNYFHHIERPGPHGAMSVYLDDAASGITILGNIFYKAGRAMFIGGGRDNLVENNIFVDCTSSVHVDARGLNWMKFRVDDDGDLPERLAAMPYKKPPWSTQYPKLVNILRDEPGAPKGNQVVRNISVGGEWLDIEKGAKPLVTLKDNLVDQDPRFVDRAGGNFQLRKDSPAIKLGFKPIPLEKIGPGTAWSFPR